MKRSIHETRQASVTDSAVLETFTPEHWYRLRRRASLLRSAGHGPLSKQVAERLAAELGVHWTTVYRWHKRFRDARAVSSPAPRTVGFPKGTPRLTTDQERIIETAFATLRRMPQLQVRRRNAASVARPLVALGTFRVYLLSVEAFKKGGTASSRAMRFDQYRSTEPSAWSVRQLLSSTPPRAPEANRARLLGSSAFAGLCTNVDSFDRARRVDVSR